MKMKKIRGDRRDGSTTEKWREKTAVDGRLAAVAAVSLTASRQHIHQAPTMLRERSHNLQ